MIIVYEDSYRKGNIMGIFESAGINETPRPDSAEQLIPKEIRGTGQWRRVKGGKHIYAAKWEVDEESESWLKERIEEGKKPIVGFTHTGNVAEGRFGTLYVAFADGGRTRTGYAIYKYFDVNRRWYYYLLNGPRPDTWFYYSFTKQNQAKTKGKYGSSESRERSAEKLSNEKSKVCPYAYEYVGTTPFLRNYQGG